MSWVEFELVFDQYWTIITFFSAALFVLYYGLTAPWYKTPFGRSLIVIDLGLAVATFPNMLYWLFGVKLYDNHILVVITVIIGVFVPLAILYRIATLWAIRNKSTWKTFRDKTRKRTEDAHIEE